MGGIGPTLEDHPLGAGRVRVTVSWLCWVTTEPMPVTVLPDGARAVISQAPAPLRLPAWDGFQLAPVADVHRATFCWPGAPNRPAAVKPAESAVSAVKFTSEPGELNGSCCQVAPPSAESSANGVVPAVVVAWPRATTRFPLAATCSSTAVEAPAGTGSRTVFQERPSVVV